MHQEMAMGASLPFLCPDVKGTTHVPPKPLGHQLLHRLVKAPVITRPTNGQMMAQGPIERFCKFYSTQ
tara:strand:+ start:590 stop:793 length:204 start_codon:yes stop_codon:yes gene_type:complete